MLSRDGSDVQDEENDTVDEVVRIVRVEGTMRKERLQVSYMVKRMFQKQEAVNERRDQQRWRDNSFGEV